MACSRRFGNPLRGGHPRTCRIRRADRSTLRRVASPDTRQREVAVSDAVAIRLAGVTHTWATGTVALAGVELAVPEGQLVAIIGPSGCGKSTALRLVAGLETASQGTVTVESGPAGGPPSIAFVFQDANLLPWRTIAANVALPLELRGDADADQSARQALARVDLAAFADQYPRELSGGMRMRASLARALVTRPRVILLDEPFGALDEISRYRLQDDLLRLHADERFTALFVTHSVSEAAWLGDRVVVMSRRPGRITADVDLRALPRPRPPDLRTAPEFSAQVGAISRLLRAELE